MQVSLLDLKAQHATIRDEVMEAVTEVMDSQYFINGPAVKELEAQIAAYCDCTDAVGVASGTDALLCALMTLGVGPGDEVITSPYTFFATGGSIWRTGAKPVFVDIEPDTFNIDPAKIADAVTDKTKAIMPVHLYGQVADMDSILEVAQANDLLVIEDAAQAIGATYKDRKAGSLGTVGCFSFFPSKNLGGAGDGGMVTTTDADLAERLRIFRNHGAKPKYFHKWVGGNFRLDTLQAAVLIVKLKYLDQWSAGRRENAKKYDSLFADCDAVTIPTVREENVSIINQYVIRVPRRDELMAHFKEKGIGTAIYYPLGLHMQECFTDLGYKEGDFPETERAAKESLALPIFPELSEDQIEYVAETVKAFFV